MWQVRLWRVERSQKDILKWMRASGPGLDPKKELLAYWKFDDPDDGWGRCPRKLPAFACSLHVITCFGMLVGHVACGMVLHTSLSSPSFILNILSASGWLHSHGRTLTQGSTVKGTDGMLRNIHVSRRGPSRHAYFGRIFEKAMPVVAPVGAACAATWWPWTAAGAATTSPWSRPRCARTSPSSRWGPITVLLLLRPAMIHRAVSLVEGRHHQAKISGWVVFLRGR